MIDFLVAVAVGLLPVVVFLVALIYLDSYKLVHLRPVLATVAAGGIVAGVGWIVNLALIDSGLSLSTVTRYVAPVIEEILKASILIWMIRSHRVGFLVDAAIFGFAVGAGFALVENLHYMRHLVEAPAGVWVIRGFGTAIMHGGTTAVFAIVSKSMVERHPGAAWWPYLPGLALAVAIHSAFNHFFFQPVLSAVLAMLGVPVVLAVVFWRSERSMERWLDVGFDAASELLALIRSGQLSESRIGRYLTSLTGSFRGEVVADMLCYLRLHLELSLRAKGELMMRESGFKTELEPEIREKLKELRFLEGTIGPTGKLAMRPFLTLGAREVWQLRLLDR